MRVEYCPYDPRCYAIGLHPAPTGQMLDWAMTAGQNVLIIRTPFGQLVDERMDELCEALQTAELLPNQYVEVCPEIWVRYMTAADKAREGGCLVNKRPATYSVYACSRSGDTMRIFTPQSNAMNRHFCHVTLKTHVEVEQLMEKRVRAFRKPEWVATDYYILHLPREIAGAYHDGDMAYEVGELKIPITGAMLAQETVYVRTGGAKPRVVSNNPGLALN